ncbi:MAG: ABC transporter permease, partial [Gemmatimonadaceae bacterium]
MLDTLVTDVRLGARSLAKTPAFTVAAVLALALGIAATTAMSSVVNGVLLRPLPYADADRLVTILHNGRNPVAPANFVDWTRETRSFSNTGAAEYWSANLSGTDNPEHVLGLRLTSGVFPLLGVQPLKGRWFTANEDVPGADAELVVSYG